MNMIKRIIIFDDDESILHIMKYILREKGWEVLSSHQSNDADKQIRAAAPSIVMMDNNIPDHGGVFAIKSIKNQADLQHIPVILFTAHSEIRTIAKEAGADAYLPKPFDLEKLYQLIDRFIS
jgi:DNA-binding NtrC family response regulator